MPDVSAADGTKILTSIDVGFSVDLGSLSKPAGEREAKDGEDAKAIGDDGKGKMVSVIPSGGVPRAVLSAEISGELGTAAILEFGLIGA
jgi:hypothetical protein